MFSRLQPDTRTVASKIGKKAIESMVQVLVVDDEPCLLKAMVRLLKTEECEVLTATNVVEALQVAQEHKPDILITDYNLGGQLDGLDLCQAFAHDAGLATARRVLVSGYAVNHLDKALLFDSFIAKPFTAQEFLRALDSDYTT